jgi:hypothetical protein
VEHRTGPIKGWQHPGAPLLCYLGGFCGWPDAARRRRTDGGHSHTSPVWGEWGWTGIKSVAVTTGDMILTSRRDWTAVRQLVPATGSVGGKSAAVSSGRRGSHTFVWLDC